MTFIAYDYVLFSFFDFGGFLYLLKELMICGPLKAIRTFVS